MRSTQDRVPSHRLSGEMALDSQGRVLRRPHFLTRREHEEMMASSIESYRQLLAAEREKANSLTFGKPISVAIVDHPQIFVRRRLHWLTKLLIQIT